MCDKKITKEIAMLYALLDDLRKQYDKERDQRLLEAIRTVEKEIQNEH
jgi:hypothetical protein